MKKLYQMLTRFEMILISSVFIFLSFAVVCDVICRKLFAFSFSWLTEFSRYTLVFCTCMGASMAVTSDRHPKMDTLQTLLKGTAAKVVQLISHLVPACFFTYFSYWAVLQLIKMINIGTKTTNLHVPLWYFYLILPLSVIGMALRSAILVYRDVKSLRSGEEINTAEENASC